MTNTVRNIAGVLGVAVMLVIGLFAISQPAQASDGPQACTWSTTNWGTNNGHVLLQNGTHRVNLDYRLQMRTAGGCVPQLRGAVNFRCYQGVAPVNCQVYGQLHVYKNQSDLWSGDGISASAGVDGVGTSYGGWYNLSDGGFQAKGFFHEAYVNGTYYNVPNGFYGSSHDCIYIVAQPGNMLC